MQTQGSDAADLRGHVKSKDFSRLADPSVTGLRPFSAELNFTHSRHMSCTYRLHFMVTWNCMQFTQSFWRHCCAAGAATFWQVLPKLSCKWSSFLFIHIWNFGAKPWCRLIPPTRQPFWFHVSPSPPLLFLKGRLQTWKVMFPDNKIPLYLDLQMIFESSSNLQFVAWKQVATSFFYSWNSARPVTQKFHEIRYTRFCIHIT